MPGEPRNLGSLSRIYGPETWQVYEALDRSLEPRSGDTLHEIAGGYLRPGSTILDAGCRDAAHLIRLVSAHDAAGVGVDAVEIHVERARAAVESAGLGDRIELVLGLLQELPYPDDHFDFVWCRDVLEQVDALDGALEEIGRVLRSDGRLLVYTVFATQRLEPGELAMLTRHLGNVPENLDEATVEAAFARTGWTIERKEKIGSEWREHAEERTQPASRALLRLSRLRRREDPFVESYGRDIYDHVEANLHWEAYLLLGKLEPVVYVLSRDSG